ncbi:MAG TPA: hypothetical protein PKD85_11425, partial [Saprospiraceae bacterium]|nr:hypothetical protein [Saprospiraceae bacterium]
RLYNLLLSEDNNIFPSNVISEEDKEKYNTELLWFFKEYERYLLELFEYIIQKKLTIEINFELFNEGTIPAEDIDIHFHFPDGFDLYDDESYPSEPSPPEAPIKPRSLYDFSMPQFPSLNLYNNMLDISKISSNVSSPTIKKTNSYDVDIHVTKLKHNKSVSLDKMYILFENYEKMKNFNVNYELKCSNVPNIVKGKLNILFENEGSI